ncbi:MAG: DUF1273 domain-containing protein [Rikenellaceae bacterium]|nr:DUF1273 domain-containing protein [Rikenellaceae bacterium]
MFGSEITYDRQRTAAFSGHRKIVPPRQGALFSGNSNTAGEYLSGIAARLDTAVGNLMEEGFDTFLCGMAAGFDLMAGLAVCRRIAAGRQANLIALIPFPGQADRFRPQDREAYRKILSFCRSEVIVSPQYRRDCFHRRNDLLVNHSSALICYYDGSPGGYTLYR